MYFMNKYVDYLYNFRKNKHENKPTVQRLIIQKLFIAFQTASSHTQQRVGV